MAQSYKKLIKLTLEEVLPFIKENARLQVTKEESVKLGSVRLRTFKNNITCINCGIKGTHFWVEKTKNGNEKSYHLNMYATGGKGNELLMTKDHILAKAKGGKDHLDNMQTMCTVCNKLKADMSNEDFIKFQEQLKLDDAEYSKFLLTKGPITIGDTICKKSRKFFKHRKRVAIVKSFTIINCSDGNILKAVLLKNCKQPISINVITKKPSELRLMLKRDKMDEFKLKTLGVMT